MLSYLPEINVRSDRSMMKCLWWTKVGAEWGLRVFFIPLHQFPEDVELLFCNVNRLVDHDPAHSLVTGGHCR